MMMQMHILTAMISTSIFFILVALGDETLDIPTKVSLHSPFCTFTRPTLRCDFRGNEQPVFLESNPFVDMTRNSNLMVFLSNAKLLILDGHLCTNMVLRNVEQIIVKDGDDKESCAHKKLRIQNVHMNSLPHGLTDIYMDSSTLDVFHLVGTKLKTLTIINCIIHHIDVETDITQGTIKVHSSKIDVIRRLLVNNTNQVQFYKSVVNYIPEDSFQLRYCSVDLSGSEITHYSNTSITICYPKDLLDENFHGYYTCSDHKVIDR
ncbi:uncharacterized protein LOC125028052 [Penaeus chinensis]|uniref:uncharacterized protein LOC125028052 n=1 Tax=Penaeus chinensis TaxID=139456 RepID=UPI001FB72C20|nr:uncharacterized protein LOC125028052 [Penaeus chinensis]